jgi:hypothetical protein
MRAMKMGRFELRVFVSKSYPLERVGDALERRATTGKLVLVP